MKRIITIIIVCSFLNVANLYSQVDSHFSVQYDISFGTGDLGSFISAPSFRGISMQYRYAITDKILIGGDLAWNVFYENKEYDSYTSGTRTLTGNQYRYQNEVPILVTVDYLFIPGKSFQPYVSLGIGTMYTERATDMGLWRLEQNPWQFAIKPEAGFMYSISNSTSLKLGLKYYEGFKAGDLDSQGYFTISTGFAFGF